MGSADLAPVQPPITGPRSGVTVLARFNRLPHPILLSAIVIGLGVFFRLRQYFFNRSLWIDEAWLANNIVQRPLQELLTTPMSAHQGAPPGFLALVKLATVFLGSSDWAVRAVPLAFGIATLFVAHRISGIAFSTAAPRLCFLGLVSFSPVLVYYSSEIKQYSTEIFVTCLLLATAMNSRSNRVLLGVGVGSLLLSFSSVFLLAAMGCTLAATQLLKRRLRSVVSLAGIGALWLATSAIVVYLSRHQLDNPVLRRIWASGYAPLPPHSWDEAQWYWGNALGLVFLSFRNEAVAPLLPTQRWFDWPNIVLLVVCVLGLAAIIGGRQWRLAGFVTLTVPGLLVASALGYYPVLNRLLLFLVPLVLLCGAKSLDVMPARLGTRRMVAAVGALALVAVPLTLSLRIVWQPHNLSNIKGALRYVQVHRAPNDVLALSDWSVASFTFYASQFDLAGMRVVATIPSQNDPQAFVRDVCKNTSRERTWIIFSHRFGERVQFLRELAQLAPLVDSWEGHSEGIFLFDLSDLGCGGE